MRRPLRQRLPNRWRFTAWVLVVVVAITAVAGVVAVRVVQQRFTQEVDDEMRVELAGTIAVFDALGTEIIDEVIQSQLEGLGGSSHALVVVGPDGVELTVPTGTADGPDPAPDLAGRSFTQLRGAAGEPFEIGAAEGSLTYRALTGQLADGRLVVVATPLDDLDDAIKTIIGVLLLVALVSTVVLGVVVALVSAHITKPLDAMIATAQSIGSGAMDVRVPSGGVEDVDRLAGALNAMLDRLEEAFAARAGSEQALRRFVADASHELRTPLAAILGYAELYQSEMARSPEQVSHAMERIGAEGERMRLLVEELLLLARLDHGRPAEVTEVDVAALVETAVADARAIAPDQPISYEAPDGGPAVAAVDATSIRQAVDNLLANTRSHTPPGTPVTVTVGADEAGVAVAVADEGPGISPDDLPHVFDRFFRAEPSRARPGGSGLGLAIVAAIAQAHGGSIEVASPAGGGARFTLRFPVVPPPPQVEPSEDRP